MLLVRHLDRAAADARLLLIGGYRDTAPELAPAVLDTLADLRRADGVTRLRLTGLQPAELVELVTELTGGHVDMWSPWPTGWVSRQTGTRSCSVGCGGTWWRRGGSPQPAVGGS